MKTRAEIGTIGHLDHGKTTLLAAVAKWAAGGGPGGVPEQFGDMDIPAVERVGGMTVAIARVEAHAAARRYEFWDCPGYADWWKSAVTGVARMDGAVWVASAAEGSGTRTREQLQWLARIGMTRLVVFLNKVDLVNDTARVAGAESEARTLLAESGLPADRIPFVRGSAVAALGATAPDAPEVRPVRELLRALDRIVTRVRPGKKASCRGFRGVVYALAREEGGRHAPLFAGSRTGVGFGGREIDGELVPAGDTGMVMPGECSGIQVRLASPARLASGTRFELREGGRTVGAGTVTDLLE